MLESLPENLRGYLRSTLQKLRIPKYTENAKPWTIEVEFNSPMMIQCPQATHFPFDLKKPESVQASARKSWVLRWVWTKALRAAA